MSVLVLERVRARLAAPTTLEGLQRRSRLILRLASWTGCVAVLLMLAGLALWTGGPAVNNGFTQVYAPYYVTDHLAGIKVPSSDPFERRFLGISWPVINVLLRLAYLLLALGAAVAFFRHRRGLAVLLVSVIFILHQGWTGHRYWRGAETLTPAQAMRALSLSDLSSPEMDERVRTSLIFMGAQAAYLSNDPAATREWLTQLKPSRKFAITLAHWRIALMQEWVAANGRPAVVVPEIEVSPSRKRAMSAGMLVGGAASLLSALGLAALGVKIRRRIRRIGALPGHALVR